jgi:hypothetical protein
MLTGRAKENYNKYMKKRRRKLREKGMCVDCGQQPAKVDPPSGNRQKTRRHTCCEPCLKARRDRLATNKRQYSLALLPSTEATL